MVDDNMLRWARDALSKGYSIEHIRNALLQRGFNQAYINDLIATVSKPQTSPLVAPRRSYHYGVWWAGLVIILIIASIATLVFTGNLSLDFGKKETAQISSAQKVTSLAKPGVVLVEVFLTGVLNVPVPETNEQGQLVHDPETLEIYKTNEFITKPFNTPVARGSGFVVSSDGYIITNAHVVDTEGIKNDFVYALISLLGNEIINQFSLKFDVSDPAFSEMIFNYLNKNTQIEGLQAVIYVRNGIVSDTDIQKGYIAEIRKYGTPLSARDVAVLKIDGKNLPTLKFGNSEEAKTGDRIFVLGYPVASENTLIATQQLIEPTLTSGVIGAERKTTDGFRLLQTDATISGGNSGGPAFDEKGEVIGISTLVSVDPITRQPHENYAFLVPINYAKSFMNEANVRNAQSPVDEHYQKGLEYFWNKKYKKAIDELESVKRLYPAHPYVQSYITEAQEALER